jgi:hypothetical protein
MVGNSHSSHLSTPFVRRFDFPNELLQRNCGSVDEVEVVPMKPEEGSRCFTEFIDGGT